MEAAVHGNTLQSLAELLATYLVHSTVLLSAAWVTTQWGRPSRAVGDLVWKAALLGGIATSAVTTLAPIPHFGTSFSVAATERPQTVVEVVDVVGVDRSPAVPSSEPAHARESGIASIERHSPTSPRMSEREADATPSLTIADVAGLLAVVWLVGAVISVAAIGGDLLRLRRLVRCSRRLEDHWIVGVANGMADELGVDVEIRIAPNDRLRGPMVAGVFRHRVFLPADLEQQLDREQLVAVLAHEVAHAARRDPAWNLVASVVCGVLILQPLNLLASRRIRTDAEFLADQLAVRLLDSPLGLARCLATLAESQFAAGRCRPTPLLSSSGVVATGFRSTLAQRVHAILEAPERPTVAKRTWTVLVVAALLTTVAMAPRANTASSATPSAQHPDGEQPVLPSLTALTLVAGLSGAPDAETAETPKTETAKVVAVPETVHGFRGQIVGLVVEKDHEKGEFVIDVQKVQRVWRNNTAKKPADLEEKTVRLNGLFGKWLDVLLVVKPGDTVQIEAKHVSGDTLQFLGEQFKKVEPLDETEEAGTGFPDGLVGFRGILLGKVVSKDVEKGVLVFEATGVKRLWKQNTAKRPESAKGRTLTVNGIAGKWLDVLLTLEKGDAIEVEAFHNRGESLDFVQEWLKKAEVEKE